MEWLIGLILAGAAAAIAYNLGKQNGPSQQKIDELEQLVLEKDAELQRYRSKVSDHFETTANLFSKVSADYQALYQHMADSSQSLIGAQPFKVGLQQQPSAAIPTLEANFKGQDTFSDESLYNAHEYRNQPEDAAETEQPKAAPVVSAEDNSADIIHLDQATADKEHPPLDYAVKEDGVINHNSLNMDNVKT
ncbi:MAG: DUF1043 family protein [Kangiellaceae bacterium]|jgi:uncharacterized membrane-anchored protein YhcB (DUF1043 family)|nr:DUF1043 family protein [Kangiellaceae bacterium]